MKINRSENAVRNLRTGFLNKIITLICPFIIRTIFIHTLGAEYLGVNSLFSSILSVLSLTELGFSSAIVFFLYRAIATDDNTLINALLLYYRKVYRIVGIVFLSIGILLIPLLPYLVKGTYPDGIQPVTVYLIFLFNTAISYFLYAYLGSLLIAFQRNDLQDKVQVALTILSHALQAVILLLARNYYAYLCIIPIFTILNNLAIAYIVKKNYPQFFPDGKLSTDIKKDIQKKVKGLMIQKLCAVSRNSFDSIFVSLYLGLKEITIYNNYFYIINILTGFLLVFITAIEAGAGNSTATETQEKNYQDMVNTNIIYMWISGWCFTCLICLYQPFMTIWAGENLLLSMSSVLLFSVYFYILKMGDVRSIYVGTNGLFWEHRYRAIAESVLNIFLNWILGKYFGINGIIAATIISLFFVNFLYGSRIVFKYYFTHFKLRDFFLLHLYCASITVITCVPTYLICSSIPSSIPGLLLRILICIVIPNILIILIGQKISRWRIAVSWVLNQFKIPAAKHIRMLILGNKSR